MSGITKTFSDFWFSSSKPVISAGSGTICCKDFSVLQASGYYLGEPVTIDTNGYITELIDTESLDLGIIDDDIEI